MEKVLHKIGEIGVVPVVKVQDAEDAVPLGKALLEGDLPLAEITFRTAAAEQAIQNISRNLPEVLVGAGTVLSVEQVKKARAAGASFIVSPGFNPKVVDYCLEQNIAVTPGVNSPTAIEMALERGLKVLKFFPAEASGGLALLKAMAGPYGDVRFIPTGGVNIRNLQSYLTSGLVHACGGTWIAKADMIAEGKFAEITRLAREAVALALGFSFARVGLNEDSEAGLSASARLLSEIFALPLVETQGGRGRKLYCGGGIELGAASPPAAAAVFSTLSMERALAFLERKGVGIIADSLVKKEGRYVSVSLDRRIGGCELRLVQG
jgi:2-dehydro-3-deoxyphosphogluconate aldolase/(4S)-4-hydroxy-2-oxoglutarate aldolase